MQEAETVLCCCQLNGKFPNAFCFSQVHAIAPALVCRSRAAPPEPEVKVPVIESLILVLRVRVHGFGIRNWSWMLEFWSSRMVAFTRLGSCVICI